jgi:hypothetical protein
MLDKDRSLPLVDVAPGVVAATGIDGRLLAAGCA